MSGGREGGEGRGGKSRVRGMVLFDVCGVWRVCMMCVEYVVMVCERLEGRKVYDRGRAPLHV